MGSVMASTVDKPNAWNVWSAVIAGEQIPAARDNIIIYPNKSPVALHYIDQQSSDTVQGHKPHKFPFGFMGSDLMAEWSTKAWKCSFHVKGHPQSAHFTSEMSVSVWVWH